MAPEITMGFIDSLSSGINELYLSVWIHISVIEIVDKIQLTLWFPYRDLEDTPLPV